MTSGYANGTKMPPEACAQAVLLPGSGWPFRALTVGISCRILIARCKRLSLGRAGRYVYPAFVETEGRGMADEQLLERITMNPKVMTGKPVIRGTRLSVEYILNLLAHGATVAEILQEYDGLTREDVQACLLFASRSLENTAFMPLAVEMA